MADNEKVLDSELNEVTGGASYNRTVRYTVVRGDTLSGIAYKFRTTINDIMYLNSIITNPDFIREGWVLTVPDNR